MFQETGILKQNRNNMTFIKQEQKATKENKRIKTSKSLKYIYIYGRKKADFQGKQKYMALDTLPITYVVFLPKYLNKKLSMRKYRGKS